ncbi:MAG: DUF2341 domain-containing protein [Dehalococcoidales bacterium]|nr:DUF2341 domain-containing protein [Dehalococcoidales bacterium]
MKKTLILILCLALLLIVGLPGLATGTAATNFDLESADGNTLSGAVPEIWEQTSKGDFESGVLENVDTSTHPGNVLISASSNGNWYDSGWSYRKKIIIDSSKVEDDLENYPLLLSLASDSALAGYAQNDGDDILFTASDGITKLDHEIELYTSGSGLLVAWVKVPSLSSLLDTIIYMYYGNASVSSQQNPGDVWNEDFRAVWHLDETGGTTISDSTAYYNDGTASNVILDTTGKIDGGDRFNGSSSYTNLGDNASLDFAVESSFTIEGWFRLSESYGPLVSFRNDSTASGGDNADIDICVGYDGAVTSDGRLMGLVRPDNYTSYARITGQTVNDNTWHYFVLTRDDTTYGNIELFLDGVTQGTDNNGAGSGGNITTNIRALASERRWIQDNFGTNDQRWLNGRMDEVRISAVQRTDEWIATTFNNLDSPSTFYSLDASEEQASLLLFWSGDSAPSGWSIVSDEESKPFYRRFPRGAASYGDTGGSTTHTHTVTAEVGAPSDSQTVQSGLNSVTSSTHTHDATASVTTGSASNLPLFRNIQVIRYDNWIPDTIPAGAIAIFEEIPDSGWTRYSEQDGYFLRGSSYYDFPTTGGSNTHTHSVPSITLSTTDSLEYSQGNGTIIARNSHTHTTGETTSSEGDTQPPFVTVILAQAEADTTIPNGMIGMFTNIPEGAWSVLSNTGGIFNEVFLKGGDTFGVTGGNNTHTHPELTLTSSSPSRNRNATYNSSGTEVASNSHTHDVTLTFSEESALPPYINVIIAKALSSGTVASAVLDTGSDDSACNALFWDSDVPGDTSLTFEIRASNSSFDKGDESPAWEACTGVSPVLDSLPQGRYQQWRATLSTSDNTVTPVLEEVRLHYFP